jgi:hypothetical protein
MSKPTFHREYSELLAAVIEALDSKEFDELELTVNDATRITQEIYNHMAMKGIKLIIT